MDIKKDILSDSEIENMSENYFKLIFSKVNKLYFDIRCLQDLNIGALLNIISTEEEYDYILHKLKNYEDSCTPENIEKLFPALKIKNNSIKKYIFNFDNNKKLINSSPLTTVYNDLNNFFKCLEKHNRKYEKNTDLTIYLNSYPLTLSIEDKLKYSNKFTRCCNCKLIFINKKPSLLDLSIIKNLDFLLLYDIIDFLDEANTSSKYFCSDGCFVDKYVSALARIDENYIDKNVPEEDALENTSMGLNVCTNFSFFKRGILTDMERKE